MANLLFSQTVLMESQLLLEYMRTGAIAPLKNGDTKEEIEAKLGAPEDWKGRRGGIGWKGRLLTDYHDSWAWHYGSLCVSFPDPSCEGLPGIGLDLGFGGSSHPVRFLPPFSELPQTPFTLGELTQLLDKHGVHYKRDREGLWVSEGAIGALTSDGSCSPGKQIVYLSPRLYDREDTSSRSGVRRSLIEQFSTLLQQPDLPAADRAKCEERLRD